MRQIHLTAETKVAIANELMASLDNFNGDTLTFTRNMNTRTDSKLKIYYSAEAYAKTVQLVFSHSQEIGWNMVIKPYKDGYKVYDVLVYPQVASGAYIHVDDTRYGLWKGDPTKVSDEADANLFGQGHSHVDFATIPSDRDLENQKQEVQLKGSGFYFFQIWNKKLDINSFFYDIDNNLYYDKEDIEMIVEEGKMNSQEFIADSKVMLAEPPKPVENQKKKEKVYKLANISNYEYNDYSDRFLNGFVPDYNYMY